MVTTIKLQTLEYRQAKTYWIAGLFILGNILLPQLCHLVPMGGVRWLPIYFFTLVGAYKYGWKAGLLTALLSPVVNCLLFGMPALDVVPAIMAKSALLALAAGFAAKRFKTVSLLILAGVVLCYQLLGTMLEWAWLGDFHTAVQDFRIGLPGMFVQVFGGYAVLRYLLRN